MASRNLTMIQAANFQDVLSPIFVKELRQGLRANQFVWPFIVVQIGAIICIALEYMGRHGIDGNTAPFFYGLLWVVFGGVLPLTLIGSLQPELSGGRNVELLLMSNLSRWQIVLGKWYVGSVLSGLMLISLIPYWLVRYLVGSVSSFGFELLMMFGIVLVNATMNAIVIGASGFRNYVTRVFMIFVSALFGFFTAMGGVSSFFRIATRSLGPGEIIFLVATGLGTMALVVILNLQMGRAKLRLFENPLDPPSTALIVVLIICTPILVGITAAITLGKAGWVMIVILIGLGVMIDPGPGRVNRKWAQA